MFHYPLKFKRLYTHRTISSQNGSTRKRNRFDQLSVWLVFVFPFPSIFIKYSFFSLINGSERKRSFKINTAFNSYDIFKSWKLFYKLFHKKSQKSLWNLDKKPFYGNTSSAIWFSETYFLQVYWIEYKIWYKNYFDFENNFFNFTWFFFILSNCSADLDVGWGLVTDYHWFHNHTRCNGKHGLRTLYRCLYQFDFKKLIQILLTISREQSCV